MKFYILEIKYYSYDSDHYDENTYEIEFSSYEKLKDFYSGFKELPKKDTPYFGEYVDIDDFKDLYRNKRNIGFGVDTGGVSTKVYAFEINKKEIKYA